MINMAGKKLFIKSLLGKTVNDSQAKTIGRVKDVVFSDESWTIKELYIKLDGDVKKELELGGFGSKVVQMPTKYVRQLGDVVNLMIPVKELVVDCEVS